MIASGLSRPAAFLLSMLLVACAASPARLADSPATAASTAANDNLHSTLWMQASPEYEATARGIFLQARRQLELALATADWDALAPGERLMSSGFEQLPTAVIVDADETMIDNSPFQARGIRDGESFTSERWLAWSRERRARPVPGALEFARYAADRGVTIFYVTNRKHATELDATADNLLALGFPVLDDRSNLLLKGDPRAAEDAKSHRRALVAANHRVLLLLGDQLSDFVDLPEGPREARNDAGRRYSDWWGERWFMLPNPGYGGWEDVLVHDCDSDLAQTDRRACLHAGLRMD